MNLKKLTVIICIIWTLIVLSWVVKNEYILATGQRVLLKTEPVDPKDLLMGDYVILNYDISQIPNEYINSRFYPNQDIYVVLNINPQNIATVKYIQEAKPLEQPYIKGKISKCNSILSTTFSCINYGIESYYIKEHTGQDIEKKLRNGTLVEISIDNNGNAKIKRLVDKK